MAERDILPDSTLEEEKEVRKQYEEAVQQTKFLQQAGRNLPGGYHRCSTEKGFPLIFASKSFETIVGYTKEQLVTELDNLYINLVLEEDLPRFAHFEKRLREEGSVNMAYRIRRRDGVIRWLQDATQYVTWDGETFCQGTVSDITDFVYEQEMFAKQKADFEQLAENIPCGYHRCTTDNGFLLDFVSDSFMETVGYSREELIGKPFLDLVAPEDIAFFMGHEEKLAKEGKIELVYRLRRRDGGIRWIKDCTMRVTHGGRTYYQCILADITDFVRKQEEIMRKNTELTRKETLMELMENNMPGGYHRCRAEYGCPFTYIGDHFTDIVGFTKEEIEEKFDNRYVNLLWDDSVDMIDVYHKMLSMRGMGNAYDTSVYRLKHKDGGYRWVTDSTMFVDNGEDSFFQSVIADITEYIEKLDVAKKEAEASNLAKSTFLFNASHDIRTPMNAIQGFAYIIERNADDPVIVRETVRKIMQSGKTLMTLLNDVLDLSRIERGKDFVDEIPLDMEVHARKLYEMFAEDMERAGIRFSMENDIRHADVFGDDLKLTRIAMNLLSNAKKFTPAGGDVLFGIRESDSTETHACYNLYVRDTGIGMSEEFQARAFEQFERERSSTESGITGSGLGLAIIKRFSDLMNGTCHIDSALGRGTEITVSIPLKFRAAQAIPTIIASEQVNFKGKRILLVEDNDFNREIAHFVFEDIGFCVDEAENGIVCLEKLQKAPVGYYDLILMDIQMPKMDGYTATREIRNMEDPKLARIPILAMTANAFEEDRQKSFAVGMNGHIGKPLEAQAVLREIIRIFPVEKTMTES